MSRCSLLFKLLRWAPAWSKGLSDTAKRKNGLAAKLMDRLVGGKEHFLRYLRGFIVISQKPVNQVESRFLVPPHQNLEGFGVAPLNALDSFRVTYPLSQHGVV